MKYLPWGLNSHFFYCIELLDKKRFFKNRFILFNYLMWESGKKCLSLLFSFLKYKERFLAFFLLVSVFSLTKWKEQIFLQQNPPVNTMKRLISLMLCSWMDAIKRLLASTASKPPNGAVFRLYYRNLSSSWWVVLTSPAEMRLCPTGILLQCRPLCL